MNTYSWLENTIKKGDVELANTCEDICFICKTPGNLLLCDGRCKRAFHFRCLKIRKVDVEGQDWYCDDCLNHRPLNQSIYIRPKEDDISLLTGDVLLQYQFLYRSIHSVLDTDNPCFYNGIQLLMVLSEISHSASYPLCSSVFHLLHYGIDKLSPSLTKPLVLHDFNDFQNCLDFCQLVIIMEQSGIPSEFKKSLVNSLSTINSFQCILIQLIKTNQTIQEQSSFIRILLLSSYLLFELGISTSISLSQAIDLSLSFLLSQINSFLSNSSTNNPTNETVDETVDETTLSCLLRLLQTVLMVLTHNGVLLLNLSLFPLFQSFLLHSKLLSIPFSTNIKLITWYFSCIRYLSYHNETLMDETPSIHTTFLLQFLESCQEQDIPLACNCIRVLFPRNYFSGFGPYPTSVYSILNKYNLYKNETPTSIRMFPLSLLYNLYGIYLSSHSFQNGIIINSSSIISKLRVSSLVQHLCGFIDLSYSSLKRGNSNLVSTVVHDSVFRKRNRSERLSQSINQSMNQAKPEEQEKERQFKLKFINGIESHFYYQLIHDDYKLKQFFVAFSKTESFPSIRVDGQDFDSFELLQKVLLKGGHSFVNDHDWIDFVYSLGFNSSNQHYIDLFKRFYTTEFIPFEK